MAPIQGIQVLSQSIDAENESHFRILLHGKTVKYVVVDHGVFEVEDMCFPPDFIALLPEFPPGDWNQAHISRSESGDPFFTRLAKTELPGVKTTWHPNSIDHLDVSFEDIIQPQVYEVISSKFDSPALAKLARFDWEVSFIDNECRAYNWIQDHDIGPRFLGFLTEEGRRIGFVVEMITDARHATPDDLSVCQQALSQLHRLGIIHGDVNRHNFLIKDGRAIVIDFECARKSENKSDFERELELLPSALADTSIKGGSTVIQEGS